MRTGLTAWKVAKGLYLIPALFAFTPLITGNWTERLTVFAFACLGLYARDDRGHRRRGIGYLGIGAVGLGKCDMGEGVEGESILLAGLATSLAFENSCGRDRRDPHSIPDEEDHVLRRSLV